MTDILDGFVNDGSDNEDIKKLFPKCKPKSNSDLNLNRLRDACTGDYPLNRLLANATDTCRTNDVNENVGPAAVITPQRTNYSSPQLTNSISQLTNSVSQLNNSTAILGRQWCAENSAAPAPEPLASPLSNHNERRTPQPEWTDVSQNHPATISARTGLLDNAPFAATNRSPSLLGGNACLELNEDRTVVSSSSTYNWCSSSAAMDNNGYNHRMSVSTRHHHQQQQHHDSIIYDDSLDVGYRVSPARDEFRLRESRIEIAGGREVFSTSRSRPAKKRFSDEILYHRPPDRGLKRHSGEVLYDDQLSRYQLKSAVSSRRTPATTACDSQCDSGPWPVDGVPPLASRGRLQHHHHSNRIVCDVDELQKERGRKEDSVATSHTALTVAGICPAPPPPPPQPPVPGPPWAHASGPASQSHRETFVLKGQRSGMFIYETVVCGTAEVVYDDIGEWVGRTASSTLSGQEPPHHLLHGGGGGGQNQQNNPASLMQSPSTATEGSVGTVSFLETQNGSSSEYQEALEHAFQRRLNLSTEAVNSEDFMSEREDDGGSSPEDNGSSPSIVGGNAKPPEGVAGSLGLIKGVGGGAAVQHHIGVDLGVGGALDRSGRCPSSLDDDDMDTESLQSSPDRKQQQPAAQLIGSLPIAQYEGSPRRYGPRPGHPQRVISAAGQNCSMVEVHVVPVCASPVGSVPADGSGPVTKDGLGVTAAPANGGNDSVSIMAGGTDAWKSSEADVSDDLGHLRASDLEDKSPPPPVDQCPLPSAVVALSAVDYDYHQYQFEESETRKVLEEFYKQDGLCAKLKEGGTLTAKEFRELEYRLYRVNAGNSYVGRRLAQSYIPEVEDSPKKKSWDRMQQLREHILASAALSTVGGGGVHPLQSYLSDMARQSGNNNGRPPVLSQENVFNFNLDGGVSAARLNQHQEHHRDQDADTASTNPDTEDLGETEIGEQVGQSRNFTLSPETTECDSNDVESEVSMDNEGSLHSSSRMYSSMPVLEDGLSSGHSSEGEQRVVADGDDSDREATSSEGGGGGGGLATLMMKKQISEIELEIAKRTTGSKQHGQKHHLFLHHQHHHHQFQQPHVQPSPVVDYREVEEYLRRCDGSSRSLTPPPPPEPAGEDMELELLDPLRQGEDATPPPPPAPLPHRLSLSESPGGRLEAVSDAINEIKQAIRKTKSITLKSPPMEKPEGEEKPIWVLRPAFISNVVRDSEEPQQQQQQPQPSQQQPPTAIREKSGTRHEDGQEDEECDTDQETDRLLGKQRTDDQTFCDGKEKEAQKRKGRTKEVLIHEPAVLIEGVLFRAKYLGSTQLVCEGQPTKATRMMQAEEAVSRIKAPEGETQPSTEVDLFISTEKIMVLNTDLKEIMMDHALRTISYIADIGDLVVLMARRRMLNPGEDAEPKVRRTPKMICHVFESEEAQFIAQSIGQAFQVAYMEFLKANGIEDHSFVKEMDYQEVLNSQEIFGDELEMFAKKEMQKEVIVPKLKGEILGVVIVESGWGSMLPTVVIANLSPTGAAARCGQLNIGDQIIAINGISLVGLPLSTCQNYIKNTKSQTVVKLTVVPCAPVVEVKIKRPDTKYQLGFSVQNGVICSLLRGGIAERGGVRVGHRIIEINGQSVVAVPHERIVNLLATSVGEIHMKTMPTSMFRLLTGQEVPVYI